ncbi:MAG: hypothetical protein Q4E91_04575 [Lachnospiraceae bacterium]|nr:hypothetical protein [Lachnospiraceae bacterium]
MLQFIMEQNLLLYVCGVACALGVVSQFLLRHLYLRLIGETQNTGEPRGKFLRQFTQRFKNCMHLNEKVNDITSFTERNMMDYQFLKMNLHQWQRMGAEALAICLLCCGAGLWILYRNGADISLQTSYCQAGILSALLIGIAYGLTDNRYHRQSLKIRLADYLQNSGAVRNYSEVEFPERMAEGVKEVAAGSEQSAVPAAGRKRLRTEKGESRAQKDKRDLKEAILCTKSGAQETAAAQERSGDKEKSRELLRQMDPREKEQILKDVLLEILT